MKQNTKSKISLGMKRYWSKNKKPIGRKINKVVDGLVVTANTVNKLTRAYKDFELARTYATRRRS